MRKRLVKFFLKLLNKITPNESLRELYEKNLEFIIIQNYKLTEEPKLLERRIAEIIFDAKYNSIVSSGEKAHKVLNSFYDKASKGDNSFMSDPLYRQLRQLGDSEIRKLKYRLKRNQG